MSSESMTTKPGLRGWASEPLVATAVVLAALAALFAAWSGWSWYRASTAGPPPGVQLRDQVLQAGEQAVQNFNTLDYRNVAAGLALWEQSSTGPLRSEISTGRAQFERQIKQTKTITTARILDGALTALNPRAGTASIIVAVQITVTPASGSPVTKQSRLAGTLTKTSSGWKLSQLGQVPVGERRVLRGGTAPLAVGLQRGPHPEPAEDDGGRAERGNGPPGPAPARPGLPSLRSYDLGLSDFGLFGLGLCEIGLFTLRRGLGRGGVFRRLGDLDVLVSHRWGRSRWWTPRHRRGPGRVG